MHILVDLMQRTISIDMIVFCVCLSFQMSLVVKPGLSGFPTRSDTNRAVQQQKMARGLKFRI